MSLLQLSDDVRFAKYSESVVFRLHNLFLKKGVTKPCLSICLEIEEQLYDHATKDVGTPEGTPLHRYVPALRLYHERSEYLLRTLDNFPDYMWPRVSTYKPGRIHIQFAIVGKSIRLPPPPASYISKREIILIPMKASQLAEGDGSSSNNASDIATTNEPQMIIDDDNDYIPQSARTINPPIVLSENTLEMQDDLDKKLDVFEAELDWWSNDKPGGTMMGDEEEDDGRDIVSFQGDGL